DCAFDGDLTTYFAASTTSGGWAGLDLGRAYVITKVGFAASTRSNGSERSLLGLFEGANQPDFSDALPLFLIKEAAPAYELTYADVDVSRAFRYVRYKGIEGTRSTVAELEFWGYRSNGDDGQFYQVTNLPTVVIHTASGSDPVDKVNELESHISVISEGGTVILEQDGTSRLRGNNSMTHPKKPYRIKFDEKRRPLGAPAKARKWTLINNYGDKTLLRNCLAFEISRRMGIGFTPWCRPVDVIMNGEYKGCYQFCDAVDVHSHRVEITEMDNTCTEGDLLTGGYLIEIDAYASKEPKHFTSSHSTPVTVKYPDEDDLLAVQFNYIRQYYNQFENSLYKSNWKDPEQGYRQYLNLPSFQRHFLVGELSGNTDTYWSTYMYKDREETQFFVEPVWDFDLAFENDNRTYPICNQSDYIYRTKGSAAGSFRGIVDRIIITDAGSAAELRNMWGSARYFCGINVEELQAYVDSVASELMESQRLNFIRWPIMNKKVHQNPKLWGSYEAEVQNVKDYIARRIPWMDNKLRYDEEEFASGIAGSGREVKPEIHIRSRRIYVSGIPGGTPYRVFSADGALEAQGTSGWEGPQLTPGIHIVNVAGQSHKVLVR
ncbi:MAG: CotH kinase family protein, partial [Bacteroidaceae bacterium]|nr:CotH kinase family protein [Bacteroidaceae bacterium]